MQSNSCRQQQNPHAARMHGHKVILNGTVHPESEDGVCTLMGPSIIPRPLIDDDDIAEYLTIKTVIAAFRQDGYTFTIPSNYDEEQPRTEHEHSLEDSYLFHRTHEIMKLTKQDSGIDKNNSNTTYVLYIMYDFEWLYIRCAYDHLVDSIHDLMRHHFCLVSVKHTEQTILNEPDLTVVAKTGTGRNHISCSPSTVFELKQGSTVVTKALCTYHNYVTITAGPTIEHMVTLRGWRKRGYGTMMLHVMEAYFCDVFCNILIDHSVSFNACGVDSEKVVTWFEDRGFEGLDLLEDELSKYLGEQSGYY
jgi:hypothetical protein